MVSCREEISDSQLEGTWVINGLPYRYSFLQFYNGKYHILWCPDGYNLYYCPSRDGSYRHYDDILFLIEDYVSYRIVFTDPNIYFEILSKDTTSNVRFTTISAIKFKDVPIFNEENLIATIDTLKINVFKTDEDIMVKLKNEK